MSMFQKKNSKIKTLFFVLNEMDKKGQMDSIDFIAGYHVTFWFDT